MTATTPRKKLIEVSMPLEAINTASAREKSIRHGHPSTLHLWWARRPLAACRAVIFGQLVDDPCSWPDRFPTQTAQNAERERLHDVIREMVEWPGSKPSERARWERALDAARAEIARSIAWGRGEAPPEGRGAVLAYLTEHAPPVYDPFSGGGSIPLEAQRLGLRAYGSDLNPVPVLISKALVEIPPRFAGLAPVRPGSDRTTGLDQPWQGAQGLAEDVRHFGRWMHEQAKARVGHLYPEVALANGEGATVIAWLWARTVASPDPAAKGAMVPLASSFVLLSKAGKEAIVRVVRDAGAEDGWRFEVQQGGVTPEALALAKAGTIGRAEGGICALTGASMPFKYVRAEGKAGRMGVRLMAVVAEGGRGRVYLSPTDEQVSAAAEAEVTWKPDALLPANTRDFKTPLYGLNTYGDLFTDRQLVALSALADLVGEARARVLPAAVAAFSARGLPSDMTPLAEGGRGPQAYADAVATYLAFGVSKALTRNCSLAIWEPGMGRLAGAMGRQAIPIQWSYAEANPVGGTGGDFYGTVESVAENIDNLGFGQEGSVTQIVAQNNNYPVRPVVISTDPPYYDNIGYADLSDFFYVWLRKTLGGVWPDLFRRLQTPKAEELVATPYRAPDRAEMAHRAGREDHPVLEGWDALSPKERAEREFMFGMSQALTAMRKAASPEVPLAIYYAFKQSEKSDDGVTSAGWATFLQAVVDAGLLVDGTWPIRSEATNALKAGMNALASSIVLVCRPRPETARTTNQRDFMAELRRELPEAIGRMRAAGIHPVDIPQAALGPGMKVFSQYALVREADDSRMSVGRAITLINQVRGEIDHADAGDLDAATRFALDWFSAYGWNEQDSGKAIQLAQSYDLTEGALREAGVLVAKAGRARLLRRAEIADDWRPATDRSLTAWEMAQALNRALNDGGGVGAAGALLAEARELAGAVHWLTGRLFAIAEDLRLTDEARGWGRLSEAWTEIEAAADRGDLIETAAMNRAVSGDLF